MHFNYLLISKQTLTWIFNISAKQNLVNSDDKNVLFHDVVNDYT